MEARTFPDQKKVISRGLVDTSGHMLEGYAALSTALYKDDLEAAQKAAADMVKHDKDSAMAEHARAITESKTIEDARIQNPYFGAKMAHCGKFTK